MGQEIAKSRFTREDFSSFKESLCAEMDLLSKWFLNGAFESGRKVGGFELEAWLTASDGRPLPINEEYLRELACPLVVPELAMFNVELNTIPSVLSGNVLREMEAGLERTWQHCNDVAGKFDASLVMIGILPTVRHSELSLEHMSHMERYKALNAQISRNRHGRKLHLNIHGRERMYTEHDDVMLESAATSFQFHMQVDLKDAVRFYNAAHILSAPMVAVTANSPYLFGKDLWDETRIPLFEQSIDSGKNIEESPKRVTFGTGYMRESLLECFWENIRRYPVLLPIHLDDTPETLSHTRLHNGTIWRWNRPLIGFGDDDKPHLRIEHRVVAAGPSIVDSIANAALFFGMMQGMHSLKSPPESILPFACAKRNFYKAAKLGLDANIEWFSEEVEMKKLLSESLVPLAEEGLSELGIDKSDIEFYINIIKERLRTGRNGAAWQRAYVAGRKCTMSNLYTAYLKHQKSGKPVHEWPV